MNANPETAFFNDKAQAFSGHYRDKACFKDRLHIFLNAVSANVPSSGCVLDFGCGPGRIALSLAHAGYVVLGMDVAPGMVEVARENARTEELVNISFEQLGEGNIPFVSESTVNKFDAVVCSSVIEYVPDEIGLLRQLATVLKPGGCLFISVPKACSLVGWLHRLRLLAYKFFPSKGRTLWFNYAKRTYSKGEFVQRLGDAGFDCFHTVSFEFPRFGNLGVRVSRLPWIGAMMMLSCRKR